MHSKTELLGNVQSVCRAKEVKLRGSCAVPFPHYVKVCTQGMFLAFNSQKAPYNTVCVQGSEEGSLRSIWQGTQRNALHLLWDGGGCAHEDEVIILFSSHSPPPWCSQGSKEANARQCRAVVQLEDEDGRAVKRQRAEGGSEGS